MLIFSSHTLVKPFPKDCPFHQHILVYICDFTGHGQLKLIDYSMFVGVNPPLQVAPKEKP